MFPRPCLQAPGDRSARGGSSARGGHAAAGGGEHDAAALVDPSTGEIVAYATSSECDTTAHPLRHPVMLAINRVAERASQ